jgi:hypothetical protein
MFFTRSRRSTHAASDRRTRCKVLTSGGFVMLRPMDRGGPSFRSRGAAERVSPVARGAAERVAKCVRRCEIRIGRLIERAPSNQQTHRAERAERAETQRYRSTAEVNAVRAPQIATHSPIDESDMTIKDVNLISRRWTARSPSVSTGGRLSTE